MMVQRFPHATQPRGSDYQVRAWCTPNCCLGWQAYQWSDIGVNIPAEPAQQTLMLGGEICMWTLEYREGACQPSDTHGCGVNQFPPSADAVFSKSFGAIVWPRAAVGAVGADSFFISSSASGSANPPPPPSLSTPSKFCSLFCLLLLFVAKPRSFTF
jgi:hypothetical protein